MIQFGRSIRWYNNYEDEVKFSKDNGFDFMQVWYAKGQIILDKVLEPKDEVILSHKFPIIIHALLDINEFDEHVPRILAILKKLSHDQLIIHPICESEEITIETIFKLSNKVLEAKKLCMEKGIKLFVENNSKLDPINHSIDDIRIMYKDNDVELLLDLAHIDDYNHLKEIVNIKKPKMIHIADKHFEIIHEHLPIGEGDLDFDYIFNNVLAEFDGKIIFEVVAEDELIIKSINTIKKILKLQPHL